MHLVTRQSIVIYTLQFNFKNKIAATVHNIQVSIVITPSIHHKARCDRGIHYSHLDKNYTGNIDKKLLKRQSHYSLPYITIIRSIAFNKAQC